ncbi:MAG TPA: DUF4337 family protein [Verrucomicrobiae bacterium]|jgi:hypothetical protein|nr:DUF4337 family protein [Verrucomicrobiae bacterium]
MDPHELQEQTEEAHHHGQKAVGLTMAIVAVFLGTATMLSHRAHTEEGTLQTKTNDAWGFYQAKHGRAHDYGKYAETDVLANYPKDVALKDLRISIEEECGVPKEEHCTSPVAKDSPIVQQLLQELKGDREAEKTKGQGEATHPEEPASGGEAVTSSAKTAKTEKKAKAPKEGAAKIQDDARELEKEVEVIKKRADHYDLAELFLELSIVLCSVTLLSENKLYWRLSWVTSLIGIGIALMGFLHT